jgi:hypothetical protein
LGRTEKPGTLSCSNAIWQYIAWSGNGNDGGEGGGRRRSGDVLDSMRMPRRVYK